MVEVVRTNFSVMLLKIFKIFADFIENCGAHSDRLVRIFAQMPSANLLLKIVKTHQNLPTSGDAVPC